MKESVIYQAILREGRGLGHDEGLVEGEQKIPRFLGGKRFGEPSPEIVKKVGAITEEAILWKLADRMLDVSNWDELLSNLQGPRMANDWLEDSCTYRAIFKEGWDKGF